MRRVWVAALAALAVVLAGCANGATSSSQSVVTSAPAEAISSSPHLSTTSSPTTSSTTGPTTSSTSAPGITATSMVPPVRADADSVTMMVIGDFGNGSSDEDDVAYRMRLAASNRPVDAFVTTGDNLYRNEIESTWLDPFGWVGDDNIPVFAAWGNHDIESDNRTDLVFEAFDPPGDWYWVRIGPTNLVVLDANDPSNPDQLAWMNQTLPALPAGPTLVSFHQPAFSCAMHGSTPAVDQLWVPIFEQDGVDLVLNGHDHVYEHFEINGVDYVVTGGGGEDLYEVGGCPEGTPDPVAFNDTDHHFLMVAASADGVQVQAIDDEGTVFDTFSIGNE